MELKLRFTMDTTMNSAYERTENDRHHRIMAKQNNTPKTEFIAIKDTQRTLTLLGLT